LTGNRGFLGKSCLVSELPTRAAKKTGITLPNGHAAIDRRVLQTLSRRGFHVQPPERNTISGRLSKVFFTQKNSISQGLSAGEVVLN